MVVCTSGIRATIGHALEALLGQTLPAQDYEVVLVVNTAELSDYAQAKARLSTGLRKEHVQVRFAHEPCLGLSVARNTGIRVAEGRYVAFIDDDGLADPRWLEQIVTRFEADERVASVGGNIFPLFEVEPPSWVTPHLYPYFSCKTF
ncbi:MAG: glycosyltransferase family 2 protein, partial [Proteobacteria bacterium]|nr:glycosyltransferase family 2 protein [Pseudomonadota bacterium]